MPGLWNIGNTTVRNPLRIENALLVFNEEGFSGNVKGKEREEKLHEKLRDRQVLEFDGQPSDLNGRKWRAAFYQLGFIAFEKYKIEGENITVDKLFKSIGFDSVKLPYQVSPAGDKLLNATSIQEIEEIYLRQFLTIELPNNFETGYPEGKMKPYLLFLEVLFILNQKREKGLSKLETGLFLQLFCDHDKNTANQIVKDILVFRSKLDKCKKASDKKALVKKRLSLVNKAAKLKATSKTCYDYADTTFRYFSLSGLFKRNLDRIEIRLNKKQTIKKILSNGLTFIHNKNQEEYLNQFYSNSTQIPTDEKNYAIKEIEELAKGIRDKKNKLKTRAKKISSRNTIEEINSLRYELLEYDSTEREIDYAKEQAKDENIELTLKYLRLLNSESVKNGPEIEDKPSYFEWAVWRAFLSINKLVNLPYESRRFPVDYDFFPRNTAPGGGSDLVFEFDSFVLIVEVTLTKSHRQMSAESEPVRRHTVQYKNDFKTKDVYCLFLAPSIDNNVAESYRTGIWYDNDDEIDVNIIPMTLKEFISSFEYFKKTKFHNDDFRQLLDKCLVGRNKRTPEWKSYIKSEVNKWTKTA